MEGIFNLTNRAFERNNVQLHYIGDFFSNSSPNDIISEYAKKGKSYFQSLKVDFALVFSDSDYLYLVRDIFGNVPLYYFIFEKNVVFSDNIISLVESEFYLKEINYTEVYAYFNLKNYQSNDYTSETFWKGIYAVLPGHVISISNDLVIKQESFFQFNSLEATIIDPFDSFKQLLSESIKNKADLKATISADLSGGIDSSSLASLTQFLSKKTINTIEFRTNNEIIEERDYAQTVVNKWKTNHAIVSDFDSFYENEKKFALITGKPSNPFMVAARELKVADLIKQNQSKYILTGQGGDDILGFRELYLEELFRNKKYIELKSALKQIFLLFHSDNDSITKYDFTVNYLISKSKFLLTQRSYTQFLHFFYKSSSIWIKVLIFTKLLINKFKKRKLELELFKSKIENKASSKLTLNTQLLKVIPAIERDYILEIFKKSPIRNKESQYHIGKHFGFNYVYPYYDVSIINFFISIPREINFGKGIARFVIRESLKGILPDEIRKRVSKTDFGPFLLIVFKEVYSGFKLEFTESHILWETISYDSFSKMKEAIIYSSYEEIENDSTKKNYLTVLLKVMYFGIWLDTFFSKK
ncbi:MAG: asparagine synthase-related protein [Bacteroidota bacterium]